LPPNFRLGFKYFSATNTLTFYKKKFKLKKGILCKANGATTFNRTTLNRLTFCKMECFFYSFVEMIGVLPIVILLIVVLFSVILLSGILLSVSVHSTDFTFGE